MDSAVKSKGKMRGLYRVSFFCFCAFLLTKPFYLLESGLPQLADYLLMGSFVLMVLAKGVGFRFGKDALLAIFIACVVVINGLYFCFLSDLYFIIASIYYIFNKSEAKRS